MTLQGADLASFQGAPGQWQPAAGAIRWAAVKITELSATGRYVDPDAAADWAALKQAGQGRVAYLFGHPSVLPSATVSFFAAGVGPLGLAGSDAVALDLEVTDDLGPAAVAAWARAVLAALHATFGRMPVAYSYRDFISAGNLAGCEAYPLWISDPGSPAGHPVVPAPWTSWAIHQYGISGAIDRDVAAYPTLAAMAAALGKQHPPVPAAPAARKAPDVILVQVDEASVPKGTTWPGVFLLVSDGSLRHVTGAEGQVDNVKSYQAAGIPGPVTITYGEYLARIA